MLGIPSPPAHGGSWAVSKSTTVFFWYPFFQMKSFTAFCSVLIRFSSNCGMIWTTEVNSIFNKWQYRNLTVYGRIKIVKTLALSKLTHVVQIIPQLDEKRIKTLQKAVNDFIWKKGYQKKTVVDFETAQLPPWAGGLGIPNIGKFWDALQGNWIHRFFRAPDSCPWKRLAMRDLKTALHMPDLELSDLTSITPH